FLCTFYLIFYSSGAHRDLHSFPTRRSSDLGWRKPSAWVLQQSLSCLMETLQAQTYTWWECCLVCADTDVKRADEHFKDERVRYRSEEHTSELQSQSNLVCRLLLEKKNIALE